MDTDQNIEKSVHFDYGFRTELDPEKYNFLEFDALNRKPLVDELERRIRDFGGKAPLTISLHGDWGTGKTFLLRMLQQKLSTAPQIKGEYDPKVIYLNAWAASFHSNPFIALLAEMLGSLENLDNKLRNEKSKRGIYQASNELERLAASYIDISMRSHHDRGMDLVKKYTEANGSLRNFKLHVGSLANTLKKDTGYPLIFIVDEIDRCRPSVSLEFLKRVKYIFNIPNIVFVFGINKNTQAQKSVRTLYGNIGTEEYLRKFFDFDFMLTKVQPSDYVWHLLRKHAILENIKELKSQQRDCEGWEPALTELYPALTNLLDLSLRKTEHSFRTLVYVLDRLEKSNDYEIKRRNQLGAAMVCLVFLRLECPGAYEKYIGGDSTCKQAITAMHSRIQIANGNRQLNINIDNYINIVEQQLYRVILSGDRKEFRNDLREPEIYSMASSNYWIDKPDEVLSERAGRFSHFLHKTVGDHGSPGWLDLHKLAGMMDLVDNPSRAS